MCCDTIDQGEELSRSDIIKEIQGISSHALRGAHEDRRLSLRPDLPPVALVTNSVGPSLVKRRKPKRGGKIGVMGERLGFVAADNSLPSTPFSSVPSTSFMSSQSPSQSHEAFGPDSDPLITISASEVSHLPHQDCSSAEPLDILSIPGEPHVKPETSFPEHMDHAAFTTDTLPHLIQQDETSQTPSMLDHHTQQPNISELDNMVGAIAVSPPSMPDLSASSTENSIPMNSTCSVEDNMIMSSSESVQRPKLRKRKAKS